MKTLSAAAAGFLLLSSASAGLAQTEAAAPADAAAVAAPTGRIGYVDIDKVTAKAKQSAAMDKISTQVKDIQRQYQERIDKIRDLEREISRTKGVVSADETNRKQKEVTRLKNEIDELEVRHKRELQRIDETVFAPLVKQIGYAIEDVAKERGFDIVLRGEAVFYGSPAVDLSDDVIRKLDFSGETPGSSARNSSRAQEPKKEELRPAFTEEKAPEKKNEEKAPEKKSEEPAARKTPAARTRPVDRQSE